MAGLRAPLVRQVAGGSEYGTWEEGYGFRRVAGERARQLNITPRGPSEDDHKYPEDQGHPERFRENDLVHHSPSSVRRRIRRHDIQLAIGILPEPMDRLLRRHDIARKLWQLKLVDLAGVEIRIEQPSIDAGWRSDQCQIAEHIFPVELWNLRPAIDESTGDGDAVAVIVFERAVGPGDGIDQTRG